MHAMCASTTISATNITAAAFVGKDDMAIVMGQAINTPTPPKPVEEDEEVTQSSFVGI